jgi:hypothetical protein
VKKSFIFFLVSVLTLGTLRADEGMWLLPLLQELNIGDMQKMGCRLSADDIYSINHSSLKDAVVIFGGGCTGEVVSGEGLLLTNHHCGYDAIQQHSSVEHDYLSDGFWARSRSEEIHTPDLNVTFLVRIEDVSDRVNDRLNDSMTETERTEAIKKISGEITGEAIADTHYMAEVKSFYGGNNFYMLVYEVYSDVRMVGAPPSSIGKFGNETDNWVWPRHTGDFSIFRIYAGPDGKPAAYSPGNVPLKPRHFLPVSLKGVEKDDFTMVMGYPGGTDRYMTSSGVDELLKVDLPARVKIRGEKQDIMKRHMYADPAVRIKYATKYARSSNYWKYSIGQIAGIKRLDVYGRKSDREERFTQWVNADAGRKARYGDALQLIRSGIEANRPYNFAGSYLIECLFQGVELPRFAARFRMLHDELAKDRPDPDAVKMLTERARDVSAEFFKNYDRALDREVSEAMLERYFADVPQASYPDFHKTIAQKYRGDVGKYVQAWFDRSVFSDPARVDAFLKKPSAKALQKDPVYQAGQSIYRLLEITRSSLSENNDRISRGYRQYIAGTLEMDSDKVWYPDANFTMRLTYGKVDDYFPRDAVYYSYCTTLKGVMEKEDRTSPEFTVPDRLKDLYESKDFGRYADRNGEMPVCFISNNDITGGNSGSPVINGKGELVGIAFDGNWEAMSGDIVFEPGVQRTISVDIRYVLFVIDRFAGATHLLDEMKIN